MLDYLSLPEGNQPTHMGSDEDFNSWFGKKWNIPGSRATSMVEVKMMMSQKNDPQSDLMCQTQ